MAGRGIHLPSMAQFGALIIVWHIGDSAAIWHLTILIPIPSINIAPSGFLNTKGLQLMSPNEDVASGGLNTFVIVVFAGVTFPFIMPIFATFVIRFFGAPFEAVALSYCNSS